MSTEYGRQISPVLKEISDTLWEIDARKNQFPYNYSSDALSSASKIFMSVAMDKFWALHEKKGTSIEDRLVLVEAMGKELREFLIKHVEVDMHEEILK